MKHSIIFISKLHEEALILKSKTYYHSQKQPFQKTFPLKSIYCLETERVLSRLKQVISWTRAQKAFTRGHLTPLEASAEECGFLGSPAGFKNPRPENMKTLPLFLRQLLEESLILYHRVAHLEDRKHHDNKIKNIALHRTKKGLKKQIRVTI